MGKLIKWLVVLTFAGGLLGAGSFAGAKMNVGKFIGQPAPPMGTQTIKFAWGGIAELPEHPRAWEFRYSKVEALANKPAKIFVSLDGKVIGTVPKDLERRVEAWRKAREIRDP
jgi:hypothetical protein